MVCLLYPVTNLWILQVELFGVEPTRMTYIKVKWIHEFVDEPIWLYGELNDEMGELRKIEIFPNGELGYAYDDVTKGTTQLSE